MRLSSLIMSASMFVGAAAVSLVAANYSVTLIEETSEITVREALDRSEMVWAEVQADGLQVTLSGIAPTEATRFAALSTAGTIVDAARLIDSMDVAAVAALAPPRFSAEILRNDAGLSVIGLVPFGEGRDELIDAFGDIARDAPVTDLIETADFPAPDGWEDAMNFALRAVASLPRSKISVEAGTVSITAISDSAEERKRLERELNRTAPPGLRVAINIAAPRPVITPFTLRFVIDDTGSRFDACSADTERTARRIMSAAERAGYAGPPTCQIGLGIPSPDWPTAVRMSISALAELGEGSVTFSDADVTLVAAEGTAPPIFEKIVGELENDLPDVFALYATLPETETLETGPPEFVATLSPEGQVQLRGRISDENLRRVAESYAQASFGSGVVRVGARLDPDLPADWAVRVLAALEALSTLSNGAVTVTPSEFLVSGNTGRKDASSTIAALLAEKLGEAQGFTIDVAYQEKLDPVASIPSPEECEAEIANVIAVSKINFEPGSATIDAGALGTMDDIAEILKQCGELRLEIQGHTDSQGREIMNEQLSQARAQSVLNELRARRVLTKTFSAKGYGETVPIADNQTEDGREANRRIEFKLIRPTESIPEGDSPLEELAEEAAPQNAEAQGEAPSEEEQTETEGEDQ